jgi:hypothetical protein
MIFIPWWRFTMMSKTALCTRGNYERRGYGVAKVIQVIECHINRGKGIEKEPCRTVTQYWTLEGELLVEKDPWVQMKEEENK